jgi:hypothetical protein
MEWLCHSEALYWTMGMWRGDSIVIGYRAGERIIDHILSTWGSGTMKVNYGLGVCSHALIVVY